MMVDTGSLRLVASGNTLHNMKNVGMLVTLLKLLTASIKESASAVAIADPRNNTSTTFDGVQHGFSAASAISSLRSLRI